MVSTSPSLAADVALVAEESFQVHFYAILTNTPEPESKGQCSYTTSASFVWYRLTFHTY